MSAQFTEEWLKAYQEKHGKAAANVQPTAEKRRKYGNVPVTDADGTRFDSRHEKAVYEQLRLRALAGEIKGIAKQVDFWLPGGVKYRADFVIFNADGGFAVIDAKSEATRKDKVYRLKKRQMMECLGIGIEEM